MKRILCISLLLLAFLFSAQAEKKAEWVLPGSDPQIGLYVLTASSDDRNMLIYQMTGYYPAAVTELYLLDTSTGERIPLDFSKYANEDYATQLVENRLASVQSENDLKYLTRFLTGENIHSPYDYIIACGHKMPAQLVDVRDDYALITLPDYCSMIINLKTGESFIPKDARALGADGTYITWDASTVYHYAPGGEMLSACVPEFPEKASLSLVYINDDGSLALCTMTMENRMFKRTFILTDKAGKFIKQFPLNPSRQLFSTILSSPDQNTYVLFDMASIMMHPAYFIDVQKDVVNMLNVKTTVFLKNTFYSPEQIAYDEEADFEAPFIPLRFNSENELIGICVTGESDLVKVNLNRNKITVLLSGTKFETLIKQKSLDSIMSPNIFTNTRSHNGSGILCVYPGGAIRHDP